MLDKNTRCFSQDVRPLGQMRIMSLLQVQVQVSCSELVTLQLQNVNKNCFLFCKTFTIIKKDVKRQRTVCGNGFDQCNHIGILFDCIFFFLLPICRYNWMMIILDDFNYGKKGRFDTDLKERNMFFLLLSNSDSTTN